MAVFLYFLTAASRPRRDFYKPPKKWQQTFVLRTKKTRKKASPKTRKKAGPKNAQKAGPKKHAKKQARKKHAKKHIFSAFFLS